VWNLQSLLICRRHGDERPHRPPRKWTVIASRSPGSAVASGGGRVAGRWSCLSFMVYDAATNKRLALTELGQEAGTNPFSFDTSRNEADPRLRLTILRMSIRSSFHWKTCLTWWNWFWLPIDGVPAPIQRRAGYPYVNLPESGTAAIEVLVGRRGYDGPIDSVSRTCRRI
jgi:hypothetical protein